jgi:hypothetical protein
MPGIILTFPIVAGKVGAWRRFCQKLAGSQRQMYEASRHRLGITRERLTLVETAFGSAAITTLEAPDVDRALGQIIASKLPFDRWYREQVRELHGINLVGYEQFMQQTPLPPDQEFTFEWTLRADAGEQPAAPKRSHKSRNTLWPSRLFRNAAGQALVDARNVKGARDTVGPMVKRIEEKFGELLKNIEDRITHLM